MFWQLKIFGLAILCGVTTSQLAQAGVVLRLTPATSSVPVPTSGNTIQFTIVASIAADVGTQDILSYELPVDLGPPGGKGLPPGWTVLSVDPLFSFPPPPTSRFVFELNRPAVDIYARDLTDLTNPTALTLTTAPLDLYSVTVEINDQAVVGNYTASFAAGGNDFSLVDGNFTEIPLSSIAFNPATIEFFVRGDANGNGSLTNSDIAPFILALTDPAAYAGQYPNVDPDIVLDFNGDGRFSNADIAGFVDALTGP